MSNGQETLSTNPERMLEVETFPTSEEQRGGGSIKTQKELAITKLEQAIAGAEKIIEENEVAMQKIRERLAEMDKEEMGETPEAQKQSDTQIEGVLAPETIERGRLVAKAMSEFWALGSPSFQQLGEIFQKYGLKFKFIIPYDMEKNLSSNSETTFGFIEQLQGASWIFVEATQGKYFAVPIYPDIGKLVYPISLLVFLFMFDGAEKCSEREPFRLVISPVLLRPSPGRENRYDIISQGELV